MSFAFPIGYVIPFSMIGKFIVGAIVFGVISYVQIVAWGMLNGKEEERIALMQKIESEAIKARKAVEEAEKERTQLAYNTSMPSVLCPHCQNEKTVTYIRVPIDYEQDKNVFQCPRCKKDFGVQIHAVTYLVNTQHLVTKGESVDE